MQRNGYIRSCGLMFEVIWPTTSFLNFPLFFSFCPLLYCICRTWPSAPARHRTKREGRGNTKSQRASSLGSPITPMPGLTSWERSSRTTSGQTPCSITWCVFTAAKLPLLLLCYVASKFVYLPLWVTMHHLEVVFQKLTWQVVFVSLLRCFQSATAGNCSFLNLHSCKSEQKLKVILTP